MSSDTRETREAASELPLTTGGQLLIWRPVGRDDWRQMFRRILVLVDTAMIAAAVFLTQIIWLDFGQDVAYTGDLPISISYTILSLLLIVAWVSMLGWVDSRHDRYIGVGTTEYTKVANASLRLFGLLALVAYLGSIQIARGYFLLSLPLGIILLILGRWVARKWLAAKRKKGEYLSRVLLVGGEQSVRTIGRELKRYPDAGYLVVGACIPDGKPGTLVGRTKIPIAGSIDDVESAILATGADTVGITSSDEMRANRVREISWTLEPGRQHLLMAPSITDVAGPRVHTREVAGLPLLHVETPRLTEGQRFTKRAFDIVAGTLALIVASPILLIVAILVKITSPGPLLFSQERIGRNGEPFRMLKFRSMRVGAEDELSELLEAQGTEKTPLFKVKDDPRITPIGKFIRKYSLDELPQLFNVIGGSMSLVGPRPQIAEEVALYDDAAHRRLATRPGLTGLWQISGRSELSWEDALRLDLYYVENWSLISDLVILAKTARVVIAPGDTAH